MTENKRFTVKPQNDLFGVNDNTAEYNVVNGIPTKIEAEWLCDTLNSLYKENGELKEERYAYLGEITLWKEEVIHLLNELNEENEELKERVKQLQINNTVLNKRYGTLISENEDLNTSKEYWREKCLSKDSYNKFHHKAPIWFTQELKLTNKEVNKVAEAIEQNLKERRIKE